MDKKLHIKAIASHTIKVDAYWYKYGDKMDCYMTPNQFKDIALSGGFEDFDIILDDDNSPKSIDAPKIKEPVVEEKPQIKIEKTEVKVDGEIQQPKKTERKVNRKTENQVDIQQS